MPAHDRSHGLWGKTAPPAPLAGELTGATDADVIVVGAGYTGLSAALHLAEAGQSVIVLEAQDIGFGGAGRNVGLINAGMWVMPDDLPGILGPDYGERLLRLLGDAPKLVAALIRQHSISCELTTSGTLHCAVGQKGLTEITDRARQWQARGAPVQVLSAGETAARIGTEAYTGSLLDLRAGTLQPLAYVRGLAQAAADAGARLFMNSPAIAYERTGQGWTVKTPQGKAMARWVVVATDAYSAGPWQAVRDEQVHLPYFNLATRPLSETQLQAILPGREGCWDTKTILSSFRLDRTGRLVFGSVGALRGTGTAIHRGWAKRSLRRLFPILADVEFDHEWYGQIGMTDNALPRLHRFEENIIGFSGYNGRGIGPGTAFGKVLADFITGKCPEETLPLPFSQVRPVSWRKSQELYYEAGSQIAHLAEARF